MPSRTICIERSENESEILLPMEFSRKIVKFVEEVGAIIRGVCIAFIMELLLPY